MTFRSVDFAGEMADSTITHDHAEQADALANRLMQSELGFLDVVTMYLGDRLGLYQALAEASSLTATALAGRTGMDERYVREWLEQQAVSGILEVDDADGKTAERRYALPAGHAEVLLDRDSVKFGAPVLRQLMGSIEPLSELMQAFRTGEGVPYPHYGADIREGISHGNRTMFLNFLGSEWLPAIPDVHARLQSEPAARVADVGCGSGWSCIAMARTYPMVHVDGFDEDEASIALARQNAELEGLTDRLTFRVHDAARAASPQSYDLVTAFECIHDMAHPVQALREMRRLAGNDGAVIVVDERAAEEFSAPGDDVERCLYGFSVLHCLPVGRVGMESAATGTVMRPDTLRGYAAEAGFTDLEVLPIENDFWRFYRLRN
jgi:SAM-dependent methyltransferase